MPRLNATQKRCEMDDSQAKRLKELSEKQKLERQKVKEEEKRLASVPPCKLCADCVKDCKQYEWVQVINCRFYGRRKKVKK